MNTTMTEMLEHLWVYYLSILLTKSGAFERDKYVFGD